MRKIAYEMARYFTVGATASFVDYAVYYFLVYDGLSALAANPLSYLVGNVVSFIGHHSITFRSKGSPTREYIRFCAVTFTGLLVSQAAIWVFIKFSDDLYAKAAAILVSGLFNYLMNRYWTFRKLPN